MGVYDTDNSQFGDVDQEEFQRILSAPVEPYQAPPAVEPDTPLLTEMATGAKRGLFTAVPEMVGGALKAFTPVGSDPYKYGEGLQEDAKAIAGLPELQKSRTKRGIAGEILVAGAEGIGQMAPVLAAGAINPIAGAATAGAMFGGSTYQDTKERMLKQEGLDDSYAAAHPYDPRVEKAKHTALAAGVVQGGGDAAMSYLGGRFLKGAFPKIGKQTVEGVIEGATRPGIATAKNFGKAWGAEIVGEGITEAGQDEAQAAIERNAGLKDAPAFMAQAAESAKGGIGTALLLGPLAGPGHYKAFRDARQVQQALLDPSDTPERRVMAAQIMGSEIAKVDKNAARNFLGHAVNAIGDAAETGSAPYALDLNDPALLQPYSPATTQPVAPPADAIPNFTPAVSSASNPGIAGTSLLGDSNPAAPAPPAGALVNALSAGGIATTPPVSTAAVTANMYSSFAADPYGAAPIEQPAADVLPEPPSELENALAWRKQQTAGYLMQRHGERDAAYADRIVSEYRKAASTPLSNQQEKPNGITDILSDVPGKGPGQVDGPRVAVPALQSQVAGIRSDNPPSGGITDDLSSVQQKAGKAQEVPPVRNEAVRLLQEEKENLLADPKSRGIAGVVYADAVNKRVNEINTELRRFEQEDAYQKVAAVTPGGSPTPLDAAAHEAATSPSNGIPEPSQAQIEAGNYKKGHVNVSGLDISIENPAGSMRKGVDENGRAWQTKLANHYGYIKGTIGRDKDHIDVFIGPQPESGKVFVVDQIDPKTGKLDEHKVMLGFDSEAEARAGYLANYDKSGPQRIGAISEGSVDDFKQWLKEGDTKKDFATSSFTNLVTKVTKVTPGRSLSGVEGRRKLDTSKDSLIVAAAKLGGISRADIDRTAGNGKDLAHTLNTLASREGKAGLLHVISNKGIELDRMREALVEQGYLRDGDDINTLLDKLDASSRGQVHRSTHSADAGADAYSEAEQRYAEMIGAMTEDEYEELNRNQWLDEQTDLLIEANELLDEYLAEVIESPMSAADWQAVENDLKEALNVEINGNRRDEEVEGAQQAPAAETAAGVSEDGEGDAADQGAAGEGKEPVKALSNATAPQNWLEYSGEIKKLLYERHKVATDGSNFNGKGGFTVSANSKLQKLSKGIGIQADKISAPLKVPYDLVREGDTVSVYDKTGKYIHAGVIERHNYHYGDESYSWALADGKKFNSIENMLAMGPGQPIAATEQQDKPKGPVRSPQTKSKHRQNLEKMRANAKTEQGKARWAERLKALAAKEAPQVSEPSIEDEIKGMSLDDMAALFDEVTAVARPVRTLSKAKKHEAFLRNMVVKAKPKNKDFARQSLVKYLAKLEARKTTPPAAETIPAKPERDDQPTPYFKEGDRIQTGSDKHGEISRAVTAIGTLIGIGRDNGVYDRSKSYSHMYDVMWDNGVKGYGSFGDMQHETDPAPEVVPAPLYNGGHVEPDALLRNVDYSRKQAQSSRNAAERAKKAANIASHQRTAETYDKTAMDQQAAFDTWADKYPEEAAKYRQTAEAAKPKVEPVAGMKVNFNSAQGGIELRFDGKPADAVISKIKAEGFRWAMRKKVWYAIDTPGRRKFVEGLQGEAVAEAKPVLAGNEVQPPDNPYIYSKIDGEWYWRSQGNAGPGNKMTNIPFEFQDKLETLLAGKGGVATVEEQPEEAKTIWNDDGTNGPVAITAPPSDWKEDFEVTGKINWKQKTIDKLGPVGSKIRFRKSANNSTYTIKDIAETGDIQVVMSVGAGPSWQSPDKFEKVPVTSPADTRAANDILKAAAAEGVRGAENALKGLYEIFGGSAVKSFPGAVDEATYAKAKPHFVAAYTNFKESGKQLAEFFQFIAKQFGTAIKPYLMRFMDDVKNNDFSTVNSGIIKENEEVDYDSAQREETGIDDRTGAERPGSSDAPGADTSGDVADLPGRVRAGDGGVVSESVRAIGADTAETAGAGSDTGDRAGATRDMGSDPGGMSAILRSDTAGDLRIPVGGLDRTGSWRETAARNLDIVELVKTLQAEQRPATAAEQQLLMKYTGWGASDIRNKLFPGYAEQGRLIPSWADANWKPLVERVEAALTPEDLKTAARSSQYAHYTSEAITRSIWSAFERMGFAGGKVFEPGMGIGNFMGTMPDGIYAASKYTGIEYDNLTAAIAQQLYPVQNIVHGDYTKQKFPANFFDVAIGNPPFSSTTILTDPDYKKFKFSLHDFFFAKTIDKVRPGGLLVFVTSRYTMDKQGDKARQYLADRADLIGAIRLPQTAFKQQSGTEAITDVIFLRKRLPGEKTAAQLADEISSLPTGPAYAQEYGLLRRQQDSAGHSWSGLAEIQIGEETKLINEYFAAHPEMVLGDHATQSSQYDKNSYTVTPLEGDIEQHFAAAIQNLPANIYSVMKQSAKEIKQVVVERDFNPKNRKEGGIYLSDKGVIHRVETGSGVPLDSMVKLAAKEQAWLADYIPLRDLVKQARYDQFQDGEWEKSLKALNKAYDAFVKKHGRLRDFTLQERKETDDDGNEIRTEYRRFKWEKVAFHDVEGPLVFSLEDISDDGDISKSSFLTSRTVAKPVRSTDPQSMGDALALSLDELGRLDLDHIAGMMKLSHAETIEALGELIYETPEGRHELADEYLSGDVVTKLAEAEQAAQSEEKYRRNVKALTEVQPKPLTPGQITAGLGMAWIPTDAVEEFAQDVLGLQVRVERHATTNTWKVHMSSAPSKGYGRRSSKKQGVQSLRSSTAEWGTPDRGANEILDAVLNQRPIRITVKDLDGKTSADPAATARVNELADKMRTEFRSWVWTDADRAGELLDLYNKKYNNLAPRRFDGSHLTLPGIATKYKLHPHQLRAIWRMIQTGNTYLAHAVGAGKTLEMIAAGMEMKRLGLISKPLYVVPNDQLSQWAAEFMDAYPLANIMVADELNFDIKNRRRFMAQAAMNAPDAIIITQSALGKLRLKPESVEPVKVKMLDAMREALSEAQDDDAPRHLISKIEKMIENAEQRFDSIVEDGKGDNIITFEELGVDFLFVDEAHKFRKLDFTTVQQVKGIDPVGSRTALDLFLKTSWLEHEKPGRSHVFASGTPVTNTMGELYNVMRFFMEEEMERDDIGHFDAWAAMFGQTAMDYELNAAGKYEPVSRFAKFNNLPELMKRVRTFMDVLTSSNLGAYVKRPDIKGGQPDMIIATPSDELKAYQTNVLQPRMKRAREWKPTKDQPGNPDPIINIITDGRLSSIDMRFVGSAKNDPDSKLNRVIDDIIRVYKLSKDFKYNDTSGKPSSIKGGTQVVFYNHGFGANVAKSRGFDARAWINQRLKAAGIPAGEVAWFDEYNTGAKQLSVMKDIREGRKKIIIGHARALGVGKNLQTRLYALHYIDPPWYPADVEQPHGRIIRQGNQNTGVRDVLLNWYSTKGSYDSTMWQMVGRKGRFIEQAFMGDDNLRTMEDISEVSQYEMARALSSGDDRVIKLVGLQADVERYSRLKEAHFQAQSQMRGDKNTAEWNISAYKKSIAKLKEAVKVVGGYISGSNLKGAIGRGQYDKAGEFGAAVIAAYNKAVLALQNKLPGGEVKGVWTDSEQYGTINGIPLVATVARSIVGTQYKNIAQVTGDVDQEIDDYMMYPEGTDGAGLARRIFNRLNDVADALRRAEGNLEEDTAKLKVLEKRLGAPYEHEQAFTEKIAELSQLQAELTAEETAPNPDQPSANFALAAPANNDRMNGKGDQRETSQADYQRLLSASAVESARESINSLAADLAADERPGQEALGERRERQNRVARAWADQRNLPIITNSEFSARWAETGKIFGGENRVYFTTDPDGSGWAVKANSLLYHKGDMAALLERLAISSEYFPDTSTQIIGMVENSLGLKPLLKQPFVVAAADAVAPSRGIANELTKRGFVLLDQEGGMWLSPDRNYYVTDMGNTNVILDENGELRFIDALFIRTNAAEIAKEYPHVTLPPVESPAFKLATAPQQKALALSEAEAWVKTLPIAKRVNVVQSVDDLPADARNEITKAQVDPGRVQAMELHGTIHVIADNVPNMQRVKALVIGHELAHAGQTEKITDMAVDWFKRTKGSKNEAVKDIHKVLFEVAASYGYDLNEPAQFRRAVKEATAAIAEQAVEKGWKQNGLLLRIFMYVKHWLRNAGLISHISDQDLTLAVAEMLRLGEKRLSTGKGGSEGMFAQTNQTETPAFKKWFGDSKVVDESGSPLVVYHGTRKDFSEFKKGIFDGPIFFSPAPEFASKFAGDVEIADPNIPERLKQGYPSVLPVYLKAEKLFDPFDSKAVKEIIAQLPANQYPLAIRLDLDRRISNGEWKALETLDVRDAIKAAGYDGMIVYESLDGERPQKNYAVFSPTQIKSATGNNGEYDPQNTDINFALQDQAISQHAAKINAPAKVTDMVKGLFELAGQSLPPRLKANIGKILSNPWFGSEGKPIRRHVVNLNLERSQNRNGIISDLFQQSEGYNGVEGLDNILKKASKEEIKLFNELIKHGDENGVAQTFTRDELYRGKTKFGKVGKTVVEAYKAFHEVMQAANRVRFQQLDELSMLPYKDQEWFDDLIELLNKNQQRAAGLNQTEAGEFHRLVRSLKRGLTDEELSSGDNPAKIKASSAVIAAYRDFWKQVESVEKKHQGNMLSAFRDILGYRGELDKLKNEWGNLRGYAPRNRKDGDWHVSVFTTNDEGERVKVYMKPTLTETGAKGLVRDVQADLKKHLKGNFEGGAVYEVEYERNTATPSELLAWKGSEVAVEALLNQAFDRAGVNGKMSVEQWQSLKHEVFQQISKEIMAQGFGRHGISREATLIEGYDDTDYQTVLKEYISGMSGWLSKMRFAIETTSAAKDIGKADPTDKVWVNDYVQDAMKNSTYMDELAATARSVGAVYYLGFKVSSALLNAFQNYTVGQAELSLMMKKAGVKGSAVGALFTAQKDVMKDFADLKRGGKGTLTAEEHDVLSRAVREGTAQAQAIRQISGTQEMGFGTAWKGFVEKSMTPFQFVEQRLNREPAILAAYRIFKKSPAGEFDATAYKQAELLVNNTHYVMGKENLPEFIRKMGPLGKTVYLFQGYVHNYLHWLYNRGRDGEFVTIARSLGAIAALGGVFALPGADDLDKWITKWFGVSYKMKFKQFVRDQAGNSTPGQMVQNFVNHGVTSVAGVDMSRALAVNLPFVSDPDKSFGERIGGAWGGLAKKPGMALSAANKGDYLRAVENLLPEFAANPMRAARQYNQGATTMSGKPIFDENGQQVKYSGGDVARKMFGFNPLEVSERTEMKGDERELNTFWKGEREDVLANVRRAKTTEEMKAAVRGVMKFNLALRKSQAFGLVPIIKADSIQKSRTFKPQKKTLQWERNQID